MGNLTKMEKAMMMVVPLILGAVIIVVASLVYFWIIEFKN